MHRSSSASLALGCALALLAGTTPASGLPAASPTTSTAPESAASTGKGAIGVVGSGSLRTRVSTGAANTRVARVLPGRTTSAILGPRFTMTVWDTAQSKYIYKRRHGASLRGASTTKILTSVGVLATLGPDHRFPTEVRLGSTPGEIILVAGGDPLLSSGDLKALAARTRDALAREAASRGVAPGPVNVRADDSLFSGNGRSRGWPSSYLPREVRPVGAFARDDRKVRDATADAGAFFASALKAVGVGATYAGEATAASDSAVLASTRGHSVAQAVSRTLLISDNDTAEMLFRHIAVARGLPGTWAGARQGLADTLRELRVPLSGVRIVDGSGLSLDGRLTAYALTSALNRALSPDHPELAGLRTWLPVAGRSGTLKASNRRFTSAPSKCAAGLIQAKTGTVADAIALAGYAQGRDGRTKIFVSIVNSRPRQYSRLTTRKAVDRAASSVTGCW